MGKRYKIHEDKATADIAFSTQGKDLNELFENAAFAVFEVMADLSTIESKGSKKFEFESGSIQNLLFDFLSEIVYLKDAEYMVFKDSKVSIAEKGKKYKLKAEVFGEGIDQEKHSLKCDVKAITLHMFSVEKAKKGWEAFVVVDI